MKWWGYFFGIVVFWISGLGGVSADALNIDAGEGIAWQADQQRYVASGRVRIMRGGMTSWSDTAIAYYEDAPDEITRIELIGSVTISQGGLEIQGDLAELTFADEVLAITGERPRLESEGVVLSAAEYLRYAGDDLEITAKGAVLLERGTEKVSAENVTGYLFEAEGERRLKQVYFLGGVRADDGNSNPGDRTYIEGEQGRFHVEENWVRICGDAKILRNQNAIKGDCAHYDLASKNFQFLSGADLDSPLLQGGKVAPTSPNPITTDQSTGRSRLILKTQN